MTSPLKLFAEYLSSCRNCGEVAVCHEDCTFREDSPRDWELMVLARKAIEEDAAQTPSSPPRTQQERSQGATTLAELAERSRTHTGTDWLCGRHPDAAIEALRVCGQTSIEDAAADLVQMLADKIDRLCRSLDAWQSIGDAIMLAVCGREAPLSDSDVIGEFDRLRAEIDRLGAERRDERPASIPCPRE